MQERWQWWEVAEATRAFFSSSHSFISTAYRPHLPSSLIRHENGTLRKRSSNRRRGLFLFMWTEVILKTVLLENDDVTTITWFSWPSFPQTQIQTDRSLLRFQISPAKCERKTFDAFQGETSIFKFLRRSVNGKHLMRFQGETSVFKFLRRSVNGKHLMRFQGETSVFKFLRRSVNGKHLMRFRVKPPFSISPA